MPLSFVFHRRLRWGWFYALGIAAILVLAVFSLLRPSVPSISGPLPQQAYLWQRAWTNETCDAASHRGARFERLIVLKTEVSWSSGQPQVAQVALNIPALLAARRPIGLALRIGSPGRRIFEDAATSAFLIGLASAGISEVLDEGLEPVELQIDFDAPESQLADYVRWIAAVRDRLAPIPVTITVLPCWLNHSAFAELARIAPDYVLQVHSLEAPSSATTLKPLCDSARTRVWIEEAARFGVPFRVALPTCGYRLAFDRASGHYAGLMAEGPSRSWPESMETRELAPQPADLASLIREWTGSHPRTLRGVLWYRLPVVGDTLNWTWPTLEAVMQGRPPSPRVEAEIVYTGDGLVEVHLENRGEGEPEGPMRINVEWGHREAQEGSGEPGAAVHRPLASESLGTFEPVSESPRGLVWNGSCRLKPGERRMVGWIRLDNEWEVRAHVSLESPE